VTHYLSFKRGESFMLENIGTRTKALRWLRSIVIAGLFAQAAIGQPFQTTNANDILQQFRDQRVQWTTNIFVYANTLFGILAVIEFAWSAAVMLLEKSDLQSWASALIRKLMWIGVFYALLINGRIWIPAIIDSFNLIGANVAGLGGPLSPGDVFVQGLNIGGALIGAGSTSAFFTDPGTSLVLILCALIVIVSYVFITINFIVTLVESYIVVSVGFIFLGFGGSRWTVPYTERYIGYAISIGIKIVLLYCLITAGLHLGVGWIDEAQNVGTGPHPNMVAFDVMGAALIFMMCCWQIPKLFAAIVGGAPALAGGDLWGTGLAVVGTGLAVASIGAGAVTATAGGSAALGGTSAAASSGSSTTGVMSAVAGVGRGGLAGGAGGGSVPPPNGSSRGASSKDGGSRRQPDPPTVGSVSAPGVSAAVATPAAARNNPAIATRSIGRSSLSQEDFADAAVAAFGGESLAGSGFESETTARGFRPASVGVRSEASTGPAVGPSGARLSSDDGAGSGSTSTLSGTSAASEVNSVGGAASSGPEPPTQGRRESTFGNRARAFLAGASRRFDRIRNGFGKIPLPSDAAPHQAPPRIPVEHEE
jgi:type IV secretion system protein TrbL